LIGHDNVDHPRDVANVLSALMWDPMHVFPGVLVGLAIAFGGAARIRTLGLRVTGVELARRLFKR
jgi:hypothetical protein